MTLRGGRKDGSPRAVPDPSPSRLRCPKPARHGPRRTWGTTETAGSSRPSRAKRLRLGHSPCPHVLLLNPGTVHGAGDSSRDNNAYGDQTLWQNLADLNRRTFTPF